LLAGGGIAAGAAIALILPIQLAPPVQPGASPPPIYRPDPPRKAREDSPLPLPPPEGAEPLHAAPEAGAAPGFDFCRGRSGDNCVIDGDSFNFQGETVRLAGIDTPEIGGAQCADERARAEAAEARLHALLNAGAVRLVRIGGRDRDRFGRLLRDAEVNGASVSDQLVAEGHARRWTGQRQPWC
jgi:endonuclease YncB( thermonuclease family)